mgnify:CR=1 FL=1
MLFAGLICRVRAWNWQLKDTRTNEVLTLSQLVSALQKTIRGGTEEGEEAHAAARLIVKLAYLVSKQEEKQGRYKAILSRLVNRLVVISMEDASLCAVESVFRVCCVAREACSLIQASEVDWLKLTGAIECMVETLVRAPKNRILSTCKTVIMGMPPMKGNFLEAQAAACEERPDAFHPLCEKEGGSSLFVKGDVPGVLGWLGKICREKKGTKYPRMAFRLVEEESSLLFAETGRGIQKVGQALKFFCMKNSHMELPLYSYFFGALVAMSWRVHSHPVNLVEDRLGADKGVWERLFRQITPQLEAVAKMTPQEASFFEPVSSFVDTEIRVGLFPERCFDLHTDRKGRKTSYAFFAEEAAAIGEKERCDVGMHTSEAMYKYVKEKQDELMKRKRVAKKDMEGFPPLKRQHACVPAC